MWAKDSLMFPLGATWHSTQKRNKFQLAESLLHNLQGFQTRCWGSLDWCSGNPICIHLVQWSTASDSAAPEWDWKVARSWVMGQKVNPSDRSCLVYCNNLTSPCHICRFPSTSGAVPPPPPPPSPPQNLVPSFRLPVAGGPPAAEGLLPGEFKALHCQRPILGVGWCTWYPEHLTW